MRLYWSSAATIGLLSLLATLGGGVVADQDNIPRNANLIDVLAASSNHTILVRLLQRTRLIPTLNNLMEFGDGRGLTILAPTDEAILRRRDKERQAREAQQTSAFTAEYLEDQLGNPVPIWQHASMGRWEWAVALASIPSEDKEEQGDDIAVRVWSQTQDNSLENINAVLRQQLLYHVINFTLPYDFDAQVEGSPAPLPEPGQHPIMHTTLHLPSRRFVHEPTRPGPIPHPPSQPPHPGAEDRGGLLGGQGQKLRMATRSPSKDTESQSSSIGVYFGTNDEGEGGAKVLATDTSSRRGIIISIDDILDLPPDLATTIRKDSRLQHLTELTTDKMLLTLTETAHATFFLPTAEAFEALTNIEKTFIMGPWQLARQERIKLLGWHMSGIGLGNGKVGYGEQLRKANGSQITTTLGGTVTVGVDKKDDSLTVDKAKIVAEDILTENGVIHIVDSLLLPLGDLALSVEKTLLALNASRFVSLMHSAGLESYINKSPKSGEDDDDEDKALPWTFMVPRDDTIDNWFAAQAARKAHHASRWGISEEDSDVDKRPPLEDVLRYHIAPSSLAPENLTKGMLVGTELRDWRLKEGRQRIVVALDDDDDEAQERRTTIKSSKPKLPRQGNGDVAFGDANVIATPVKVGPSIIYLISKVLEPPLNPIQTAVSSLSLSTFVATVFSAELDKPVKRAPAVTYLIPHNDAFEALGLAMPYLLLDRAESRQELRSVVEYHAIDKIVYTPDFASGQTRYPTLEGSPIWAGRDEKGVVEIKRGTRGRNARIIKDDILTSTGVIHEIDQVELPPTLDLTIDKLFRGAKSDTMRDLVIQAGYGWILNGTRPTSEEQLEALHSKWGGKNRKNKRDKKRQRRKEKLLSDEDQSYVVLCPTDAAFAKVNLTAYLQDKELLERLVLLHIIPSPSDDALPWGNTKQVPIGLQDSKQVDSLLDRSAGGPSKYGKLAFRKLEVAQNGEDGGQIDQGLGWVVGVADTRGTDGRKHSARILSFGRESLAEDRTASVTRKKRGKNPDNPPEDGLPNSQSVGGVFTLDAVLQPYEPGWFYRWGWMLLSSLFAALVLAGIGYGLWVWWQRDGRIRLPDAMEGEEE